MTNIVNLERVSKSYGVRPLLSEVSLGVAVGERIGVVGRNGDGKTTLLRVLIGLEEPDGGRVSQQRGLLDRLPRSRATSWTTPTPSARRCSPGASDHEWAADPRTREVVEVLLAGVTLDRAVAGLSGGERRRCSLAALLLGNHDLVVLDEPTNHLDVEAVAWLAQHMAARAVGARGGHPRPLVPRRRLRADLGGPRRRRRQLRGRLRGVRAGQGRAVPPGRRVGGTPPEPGPQGAGLAPARPAGPDLEAEVPDRRRERAHRRRTAAAGPDGAPAVRDPTARQGRAGRRGRRPAARGARRCCRTRPGGSGRATGSASSASTAPGSPRCSACCPASSRRPPAG